MARLMVVMPVRVGTIIATAAATAATPTLLLAVSARIAVHAPASRLAREHKLIGSWGRVVQVDGGAVLQDKGAEDIDLFRARFKQLTRRGDELAV